MTESFKKKAGFSRCSSQSPYPKEFGALRIVRVNFDNSRRLRKLLELAVVGVGA